VDFGDRGETGLDGPLRFRIGQADADRDIGAKERTGPLDDRRGPVQSAFS